MERRLAAIMLLYTRSKGVCHMTQVFTVVTYILPEGTDRETALQMFRLSIPRYMATEGLVRKNVLYQDGLGGGAYLWESREAAEKAFSPEWTAT